MHKIEICLFYLLLALIYKFSKIFVRKFKTAAEKKGSLCCHFSGLVSDFGVSSSFLNIYWVFVYLWTILMNKLPLRFKLAGNNTIRKKIFKLDRQSYYAWSFSESALNLLFILLSLPLLEHHSSLFMAHLLTVTSFYVPKVIYTKFSKHCPYTVAHTIDSVCRKC